MQITQIITDKQINKLIGAIFVSGDPIVKEAYSDFDATTKTFQTGQLLRNDIKFTLEKTQSFFFYSIYYPAATGIVTERRIELTPGVVKDHTHRFCQEGWGLIFLKFTFKHLDTVECNVSVNSQTRANNWAHTTKRMGDPNQWEWDVVKRHASRLIRLLRRLAKLRAEKD